MPHIEKKRVFLTNSGTEAVEGAIKLAHRATGRREFVSTTDSFHGRTLGALSVIGQPKYREPYQDLMHEPIVVPFGDPEAATAAIGERTAAVIVEPVQGEGGVNPAPDGYLAALRRRCSEVGALLIFDEVQTGFGRTGRMLAQEHQGVVPDIFTLGKGLGGGFPVAAFVCTEGVAETVRPGDHGGTYIGNPLACAAVNAVLEVIAQDGLVERAERVGQELSQRLTSFAHAHPDKATGERGLGLLRGLVLADPDTAAALPKRALAEGILVNVTAGNVMRFFPALNIPEDQLFEATDTLLALL